MLWVQHPWEQSRTPISSCWAQSRLPLGQHEVALIVLFFALELVEDLPLLPVVLCTNDGHLEELAVELHGAGAVVVPGDGVGDEGGVTVRVHHPHRGDVHLGGIPDGHVGLKDVVEAAEEDYEVGQADAGPELDVGVGEQAALPVARVRVLPALPCRALNQVAELAVAADEEDDALAVGDVGGEVEGQLEMIHRLVQVDDVLIQAAAEDVGLHEPAGAEGGRHTGPWGYIEQKFLAPHPNSRPTPGLLSASIRVCPTWVQRG